MKYFFAIIALLNLSLHAQNVLHPRLYKELSMSIDKHKKFPIRIEMSDNLDLVELNIKYTSENTPIRERASETIKKLKKKSLESKKEILSFFKAYPPSHYNDIRDYWIVNHIYIECDKELVYQISQREDVAFVDLNTDKISPLDVINYDSSPSINSATETGLEAGIIAINAQALWNLGYTGKGQLVYDYDTGVCAEHPTFKKRFLANHSPMQQSWYGYFRDFPNEINSNHGTHTLGTIVGEGLPSGDTVGVAPGAYWMACDLVTSTVDELPPLEYIVAAYQWALDTDNNPNTTKGMPAVINNSWRWNDNPDTTHCNDYIQDLMNVIETVGIANIFSGGNSGPNNNSISAPQRINSSILNTFSVGSVNTNLIGNPISSFSSRGPVQCPANDSLLLFHPQVVAPGQNIRSSVGINSFSTKSGTSMAAPHVSGAILLLKEAFPELSGSELLGALYHTAIDKGEEGEDNTYGRGMIDCLAAFEFLSQSYLPIDPLIPSNDLAIIKILQPGEEISCLDVIQTNFSVQNMGVDPIDSLFFTMTLNGITMESKSWTGNLTAGEILDQSFNPFTVFAEDSLKYELQICALSPNLFEKDTYNNCMVQRFMIISNENAPLVESFESNTFSNNSWQTINIDGQETWIIESTMGLEDSELSAKMPLYSYDNIDQRDVLISPNIEIEPNDNYYLSFKYAHQHRNIGSRMDSLIVQASPDCGLTFKTLFAKGGYSLQTVDSLKFNFRPKYESHWDSAIFYLNDYFTEQENILVKFISVNGKQNNLYLDNVVIAREEEMDLKSEHLSEIKLIPNPAKETIALTWTDIQKQKLKIDLLDLSGRVIRTKYLDENKNSTSIWDISACQVGLYLFRIQTENKIYFKKMIKN
ncbi:MAG: hypothetical protein CMP57_00450 [Flavobacteriales bacterium]|nr:hypothetical protein [Flavobacteriales bacterium]|tara:strand:+ start:863 stop:3478 length:2616 start_codon:yes stop_codon:yes gene_type:complete